MTKKSNSSFIFWKIRANVDNGVESLRDDISKWGPKSEKEKNGILNEGLVMLCEVDFSPVCSIETHPGVELIQKHTVNQNA